MKSARTWPFFILAVIVLMLRWKMSLDAAPSQALEKTVRINVPADRPDVWFAETKSLVAVPRDEFEQLLKNSEQEPAGPKPAQLSSAQYTATLAGQALRNGRAQLAVQKIGKKNSLMPLGQFNLAVRDLKWTDRPAIWGTDDTGQGWLLADVASGEIEMNWSAAGRTVAGELNFDLQFPAAAHSVLDVRVPRDQELRSTPEARRIEEGAPGHRRPRTR